MGKNKKEFIESLKEKTNRTENECIIINEILEENGIIGHHHKEKIKADFISKLNLSEQEADDLYNTCCDSIIKGIFKK